MYPLKWRKKWLSYSQLWEGWLERRAGVFREQGTERHSTVCSQLVCDEDFPEEGVSQCGHFAFCSLASCCMGWKHNWALPSLLPSGRHLWPPELALCHTDSNRSPPRSLCCSHSEPSGVDSVHFSWPDVFSFFWFVSAVFIWALLISTVAQNITCFSPVGWLCFFNGLEI